jgi:NitT/TauT family transport system ATP-binding protein
MNRAAPTILLSLKAASFAYCLDNRQVTILQDVDLSLGEGDIVAVVGKSGVGKSTLLGILAGQLLPDLGELTTVADSEDRLSVLYQPQIANLLPWQSLHDNVLLGLRFAEMQPTESVTEMLDRFDLNGRSEAFPLELSGGQIERATLARTLLTPAAVYLLDEPLSGTDYPLRLELESYLVEFVKRHSAAAVIVTHDIPEALAISDKILLLRGNGDSASHVSINVSSKFVGHDPIERRASPIFGSEVQKIVDQMGASR